MDKITICNMALNYLSLRNIASLEENTPAAKTMALFYDVARDVVLADHPWNFALARKRINLLETDELWHPIYHWAYTYPNDAVKVWGLQTPLGSISQEFEVGVHHERTAIFSNIPHPIAVYTMQVVDVSRYSPIFVQALARKIAAMSAMPLLKTDAAAEGAERLYTVELSKAKLADATEGRQFNAPEKGWNGGHDTPTGDWVDMLQRNYRGM